MATQYNSLQFGTGQSGYGSQTGTQPVVQNFINGMPANMAPAPRGKIYYGPNGTGVGPGGKSGASSGSGNPFLDAYKADFEAAKAANEKRYQEINQGYTDRYGRTLGYEGESRQVPVYDKSGALVGWEESAHYDGLVDKAGIQERADLRNDYGNLSNAAGARAISAGLGSTTVAHSLRRGVERDRAAAEGRLNDRLTNMRIAYDSALSGDQLQFQERRNDTYPESSKLEELAFQYGQGQGAMAGGGGGGFGGGAPVGFNPEAFGGGMYSMPSYTGGGVGSGVYSQPSQSSSYNATRAANIKLQNSSYPFSAALNGANANDVSAALAAANARAKARRPVPGGWIAAPSRPSPGGSPGFEYY